MRIDSREQHYTEAKRRLDFAAGRLSSLDAQIVDVAGAMAYWRASWRQTHDPDAAVAKVLSQPWPDREDVERAFEDWLASYHAALEAWVQLSSEAQLRLVQPTRS
ncbi:MAG: hypothetical protein O3A10_08885 [Chloroflexi bacterium]|nr:hypothetical protein [Chloroflexota bacterium]MDA1147446.1 hypothetical protein [Chloroflexota bacterium]